VKDYSTDYLKNYVKRYEKDYSTDYAKVWLGEYTKIWNKDYTTIYTKIWSKDYSTDYNKDYVKTYTKIWSKDYSTDYNKDYVKTYSKNYVKAYERVWTVWIQYYSGTVTYTSPKAWTATYAGQLSYDGVYAGTAYEKAYDGAVYTKIWSKDYVKNYDKDYTAVYQKAWNKLYQKAYVGGYTQEYIKDWTGPTYYGGFASGSDTSIYSTVYTKIWTRDWTKDYSKAWETDYTKIWTKSYLKNYVKDYTTTYQSTYTKEYIGGYEGTRSYAGDVGFVNLLTTIVYTSPVNYTADGLYFGSGITNYRGTFDGTSSYSADYTKIWLGNTNYMQGYSPTYTGLQYFETQWQGTRTSHSTFVGNTNFIGAHSGALANTKPRLFVNKDENWEQAKKLWIRTAGVWKEVPYFHTKTAGNWKLTHIGHKQTEIFLNGKASGPLANTADEFYMRGENDTTSTPDTLGEFSSKGSTTIAGHDGSRGSSQFVNNFNLKEFLDHKGRASGTYPTMTTIHVGQQDEYDTYYAVGSNTAAKPAIDLTGFSAISINQTDGGSAQSFTHLVRILVHNNGYITGCGGAGGAASADTAGADGANGGTAIKTDAGVTLFVENYGTIGGGGGGGGAGGLTMYADPATGAKSSAFAAY